MINPTRFPFINADPSQPVASLMPILPLTLQSGSREVDILGLVDTGSAVNVLPYSIGKQLGLIWEEQSREITLSGNLSRISARGIVVTAIVNGSDPVRLAFAWAESDNVRPILGQANFFMEFDVCVFRSSSEFEITQSG